MGTTSSRTKKAKAKNREKRALEYKEISYHTLRSQIDQQVFKDCELKLEEIAMEFAAKRTSIDLTLERRHTTIGTPDEEIFDHEIHRQPRRQTFPALMPMNLE